MTEIATNSKIASNSRVSQWLFNPFKFVAGFKALLLGLVIIVIATFIGSLSNTHFDGVLDVHAGQEAPLWFFFAEGFIDWMCMVISLLFFGLIVSRSSFRVIDIFGTQALARWPALLTALAMYHPANQRIIEYFMSQLTQTAPEATINPMDITIFVVAMIVTLLMIIWMIILMYRAYCVSCNVKGAKAIGTFIAGLVCAEVLSKVAILLLPALVSCLAC